MPISQQYEPVIGFATSVIVLAGVAVMMRQMTGAMLHHSIPWEDKQRLSKLYGTWAVNRSEAMCPEGDVACVEREAKRMMEVIKYRR